MRRKTEVLLGGILVLGLAFGGCQATYSKASDSVNLKPNFTQEDTVTLNAKQLENLSDDMASKIFNKLEEMMQNQVNESNEQVAIPVVKVSNPVENKVEEIVATHSVNNMDGMNLFRKQACTIGERHFSIEGYTDAGIDEEGAFVLDDGQRWGIIVREGDKVYTIFGPVNNQLGKIDYSTYLDENNNLNLVVYDIQGAGIRIISYEFDPTKDVFKYQTIYEDSNINYFTYDIELAP